MFKILTILILAFSQFALASFELTFPKEVSSSFKDEVEHLIPQQIKDELNRKISVEFIKMDGAVRLLNPCTQNSVKQTFGKTNGKKIFINKNFLEFIDSEGDQYNCGHGTSRRLFIGTIIHELGHIFDMTAGKAKSSSPLYSALAHSDGNKLKNTNITRSPDPYEFKNISEHFAVNLEFFLLDNSYACRRPNLASHFSKLLNFPLDECRDDKLISGYDLDADKIDSFHYLQAGVGEGMASRFGHSMFRLKMKNGEDIVIGFLGEVTGATLNPIKGLFGKYSSRIVISPFSRIHDEYTKVEWRTLESIPLLLGEQEKINLVNEVKQLFWEYTGRYYFLSNNCATEALSLAKVIFQDEKLLRSSGVTPSQVMKIFDERGLLDKKNAIFYTSYTEKMKKIYEVVSLKTGLSFEKYLELNSKERMKLWEKLKLNELKDTKMLLTFLSLENTLLSKIAKSYDSHVMTKIESMKDSDPIKKKVLRIVEISNTIMFSKNEVVGYGIPTDNDLREINPHWNLEQNKKEYEDLSVEVTAWAKELKNPYDADLQQAEFNQKYLKKIYSKN